MRGDSNNLNGADKWLINLESIYAAIMKYDTARHPPVLKGRPIPVATVSSLTGAVIELRAADMKALSLLYFDEYKYYFISRCLTAHV